MNDITYMDCWNYIAPLIPVTSGNYSADVYVMVFHALKEAEERRKAGKKNEVDAVPVVRCKDCKYKDKWETNAYGYQWCGVSGLQVVEDISFCSYGERKGNERGDKGV